MKDNYTTIASTVDDNLSRTRIKNKHKAHRAIWRAVITQALVDATSANKKPRAQREKAKALRWLQGRSRSFHDVCNLAELDPRYVRQKAKRVVRLHKNKLDTAITPLLPIDISMFSR